MIAARSKARGVSEAEYMAGNLLNREVLAEDVAQAFVALAKARKTTGHIETVDGGDIRGRAPLIGPRTSARKFLGGSAREAAAPNRVLTTSRRTLTATPSRRDSPLPRARIGHTRSPARVAIN